LPPYYKSHAELQNSVLNELVINAYFRICICWSWWSPSFF